MTVSDTPKRCQACPSGCAVCDEANGCTQCDNGFHPNPTAADECKGCPTGCATCQSQNHCLSCSDAAHFLVTDKVTCSTNCGSKEYKDTTEKKCKSCTNDCLACNENDGCTNCEPGYFIDSKECTKCPTGCSSCSSLSVCLGCTDPTHYLGTDQLTCGPQCGAKEYKDIPDKKCKGCVPFCQSCSDGNTCDQCETTAFKKQDNTCQPCPRQCSGCKSETECTGCLDSSHFLFQDQVTCDNKCPSKHYGDEVTKKCQPCKENCKECSSDSVCTKCEPNFMLKNNQCIQCVKGCKECKEDGCKACEDGMMLSNGKCEACPDKCELCDKSGCLKCSKSTVLLKGECILCPEGCISCQDSGCSECKKGMTLVEGMCQNCEEDCLSCNQQGCLECRPNLALHETKCKKAKLVDYGIRQSHHEEVSATFVYKIIFEMDSDLPTNTKKIIEENLLQYEDKFSVSISNTTKPPTIILTKSPRTSNEYILQVNVDPAEEIKVDQKVSVTINSFSKVLDPQLSNPPNLYTLYQKSEVVESHFQDLTKEPLPQSVQRVATAVSSSGSASSSATMGLGFVMSLFSRDPNGVFLKFNQFLTLIERVKFIGMFFGRSLESFINMISGGSPRKTQEPEKQTKLRILNDIRFGRILEVSLKENQKEHLDHESKSYHYKLDEFQQSLFFEGSFMIKSVLYDISWFLKLAGLFIFSSMKKKMKVVKWKLKFLKYQRKLHFIAFMSCIMDLFFFCSRVILHRKNTKVGLLVKSICCLNLTLMTLDFMEIADVSINLSYESEEDERENRNLLKKGKMKEYEERKQGREKNSQEDELFRGGVNRKKIRNSSMSVRRDHQDEWFVSQKKRSENLSKSKKLLTGNKCSPSAVLNGGQKKGQFQKQIMNPLYKRTWKVKGQLNTLGLKHNNRNSTHMTKNEHPINYERTEDNSTQNPSVFPNKLGIARDNQRGFFSLPRKFEGKPITWKRKKKNSIRLPFGYLKHLKQKSLFQKSKKNKIYNEKDNTNKPRSTPFIFTERGPKIYINHPKTLLYNGRNMEIEKFCRSILVKDPRSYKSSFCLLNNLFNVIQLAVLQITIVSLPNSPTILISILMLAELLFFLMTLVPYFCIFKFISVLDLIGKFTRFIFLEAFFLVCLIISLMFREDETPVKNSFQYWGIVFISLGIFTTYLFQISKMVVIIVNAVKGFCKGKGKKSQNAENELMKEKRGLIFYSDVDPELRSRLVEARKSRSNIKPFEPSKQSQSQMRIKKRGESREHRVRKSEKKKKEKTQTQQELMLGTESNHKKPQEDLSKGVSSWNQLFMRLIGRINLKKKRKEKSGVNQDQKRRSLMFSQDDSVEKSILQDVGAHDPLRLEYQQRDFSEAIRIEGQQKSRNQGRIKSSNEEKNLQENQIKSKGKKNESESEDKQRGKKKRKKRKNRKSRKYFKKKEGEERYRRNKVKQAPDELAKGNYF